MIYINLYINWYILVYKFSLTEYIKSEFLFDFFKKFSYSSQFDIISYLIELCFLINWNAKLWSVFKIYDIKDILQRQFISVICLHIIIFTKNVSTRAFALTKRFNRDRFFLRYEIHVSLAVLNKHMSILLILFILILLNVI